MANGNTPLTTGLLTARRRRNIADLLVKSSPNAAAPPVYGAWLFGTATTITHDTTGAVTGLTSVVTGTTVHKTLHTTTGTVTGDTSSISGTATKIVVHTTTGSLTGLTSVVTGTALRYRTHTTSGAVTGLTSEVTGSALRYTVHTSTGVVVGLTSNITGTGFRYRVHDTTGVVSGLTSDLFGSANHNTGVVVHDSTGEILAEFAVVTGSITKEELQVSKQHGGGSLPSVWELFVKRKRIENMAPARKKAKAVFKRVSKLPTEKTVEYIQKVHTKLVEKEVVEVREVLQPFTTNHLVDWFAVAKDVSVVRTLVSMDVFMDFYPEEEEVLLLLLAY